MCASQAIQALQNTEIKVSLNGEVKTFKDETTGEVQYPITYHDRTYLPIRNVANLAGLSVDYDRERFTLDDDLLQGTFSVTLAPGASIDYDVDVTNDGRLHAVADTQVVEVTGDAQDKITCTVTPTVVQDLYKEGSETTGPDHYKVTIKCADSDELPTETQTATVKVTFKYVQKHTN